MVARREYIVFRWGCSPIKYKKLQVASNGRSFQLVHITERLGASEAAGKLFMFGQILVPIAGKSNYAT